ncbi:MAG: glycosyltransferase [Muribaculaceae bacterium]|nr:glycosyltransferase [Muribaculaceae bacterium]
MESTPLISIITITYNAKDVIVPTMKSIHSQSFGDFEHIIVDGASTDETLLQARSIGNARILSERDNGLYDAMNKGINMARGKYLLFLNAGDSFHNDESLAAYAEYAMRDYDIIYGDTVIVDARRHIVGKRHLTAPTMLTVDSFAKGMLICHQAFMVKREIAPLYDTSYRFSADYDWTIRCIKASDPRRCVNLNRITIDYLSDGLTDKNKVKSLRERYAIMAKHYGKARTLVNHVGFIFRALKRKISDDNVIEN